MNEFKFIANLGKDPELRYTSNGKAVCNLWLIGNKMYKDSNGAVKDKKTAIGAKVWGKRAEWCAQTLIKGNKVLVVGPIDTRSYDNKEGKKVNVVEIVADTILLVGNSVTCENNGEVSDDEIPF